MKLTKNIVLLLLLISLGLSIGCKKEENAGGDSNSAAASDPMSNKGIGPVTSVTLGALDEAMANKGKVAFESKCLACHKFEEKVVGPALADVTKRRTPEWIMNMILNPMEMTQKDPIAQELFATHLIQMTFQNISQDEAREILEYFRKVDSK